MLLNWDAGLHQTLLHHAQHCLIYPYMHSTGVLPWVSEQQTGTHEWYD